MEDLFQIIIIIFFILSSIASSMKKKKKKQQAQKSIPMPVDKKPEVKQNSQKTSADILEEILGLKVEIPEPLKSEAPIEHDYNKNAETWDPSSDYGYKTEEESTSYEQSVLSKKLELLQEREKYMVSDDKEKRISRTKDKTLTQKLFSDKANLKEYIIIQEVLNKPKALRR